MSTRPSTRKVLRGFTLIEAMVAIAIIGLLAAVVISGVQGFRKRGDYASATGELLVSLREARSEAYGRGMPTVFVVDTAGGRWWSVVDVGSNFDLTAFDPANPAPSPDILLAQGTLPSSVTFGPSSGYGTLPAPFAVVPANTACTFCLTGGGRSGYGAITFRSVGGALFNGSSTAGGSVTLQGAGASGSTGKYNLTVAVVGRTGAAETFEVFK